MSMIADTVKPAETYGRGLYAGVLVFVSLLSVAGNAVYAYAAPAVSETSLSPGWAAAAHMIPPVTLLLVTEVLAMASSKFSGRGRAWALAGVVVIAGAAFALSFDALYEVAQMAKVRTELAWLVPVMLDVAIIVCTVLVLMASRQMQRDRAGAAVSVTPGLPDTVTGRSVPDDTAVDTSVRAGVMVSAAPSVTAGRDRVDSTGGHPVIGVSRAVQATVIPPVTDTVTPLSRPADQRVDSQSVSVQDAGDTTVDTADTGVQGTAHDIFDDGVQDGADTFDAAVQDIVSGGVKAANDTAVDTGETVADTATAGVQDTADDTFDDGARDDADTSADTLDMASVTARVIADVGTTADPVVVERVLALALDGLSARRISDELAPDGPSRTPIAAWVKAAKEIDAYAYALAARRQLVAAGN